MTACLDWPFFTDAQRRLAEEAAAWAQAHLATTHDADITSPTGVDARCRALVRMLGTAGWLRHCVTAAEPGARLDVRTLCLLRETLARHSGLADFAFAMQGLGAGPIVLCGDAAQKAAYLPRVADGTAIAAFALSESGAGSDAAALTLRATRSGTDWVLDGEKTWVSNGGIADFYIVFARSEDLAQTPGAQGLSAFIVDAGTPGLIVAERIETLAPHPLARLEFSACRIPARSLIGRPGAGFAIAMRTLDPFRIAVGAAALGFAGRARDEAIRHAQTRSLFGKRLADMQMTQATLADMAVAIDAAALLVYRAAWQSDGGAPATREAAMAKLCATENAQRVIDAAVQLFGARGVRKGEIVEALYREIRALRIYEGASEVQKLIVAREELRARSPDRPSANPIVDPAST